MYYTVSGGINGVQILTLLEKQMQKLKNGDKSAMEQIYAITKNAVFSIIYSVLRDYGRAEEVMQETYIKVWNGIDKYKTDKAHSWIYTIARNLALNSYNKHKREVCTDFTEVSDLFPAESLKVSDESGVFKAMEQTLDSNEYKIVLMHTVGGLKLKEIAIMFDKPQGTVRWQYNNALKKLVKNMNKEDGKNE